MISGCQMRYGRPRSNSSATLTSTYPRNAVRIVGRTIGVQPLDVEDVHRRRQREAAGGQHHAAQHVEADPHSPGKLVAERLVEAPRP